MNIYLLDPRSDIFQTFQDANQLFGFLNRSSRNMKGKTLIVRKGDKAKVFELNNESPSEIHMLTMMLQNDLIKA